MKTFEEFISLDEDEQLIDLISYPSGHIIEITPEEFNIMMELADDGKLPFEIGQWRYLDEEEEQIENWLEEYRNPVEYNTKRYNL